MVTKEMQFLLKLKHQLQILIVDEAFVLLVRLVRNRTVLQESKKVTFKLKVKGQEVTFDLKNAKSTKTTAPIIHL